MVGLCVILTVGVKCSHDQQTRRRRMERFNGSAEDYVNTAAIHYDVSLDSPFIDGLYCGYYKQYGRNYPMVPFEMEFNDGAVTGQGYDCVGDYRINGIYSDKTGRMAFNKTYIKGTGDLSQNFGHTVKIRLQYQNKSISKKFEGRWYVKTHRYEGSGSWVISKCGNSNKVEGVKTKIKDDNKYQTVNIEEGEEGQ